MASTRQRVSLAGVLRGQGHEAKCTVWATSVSISSMPPEYLELKITNVAEALPDGEYTVTMVNGLSGAVRHAYGDWVVAI
jgi:hypothetical protein